VSNSKPPLSQRLIGFGLRASGETVRTLIEDLRKQGPTHDGRVLVAQATDTVRDVIRLFESFDVHHLPVVASNKVIGIVSSNDILKFFQESPLADAADLTLEKIMTPGPKVIQRDAPVRELIEILAHARFHCVPVLEENGEIWDIVTTRDLVRYLELIYAGGLHREDTAP
jgi:CBS-domain-containing membrane protein